ncbi:pyocin knob domain-containing protein [Pseudomonas oryzihabitans]|uniref:pyocin knob domain-containing protein n=1 Tax=Pseudomonas oryzihabitans TaxID=47885 RepID=UPI0028AC7098|nr:pyocin knob domain-containing protein [Pseudomonas oryzihabitans]
MKAITAAVAARLPLAGGTLSGAINESAPVTLPSAATVNIGAATANTINITGTTTITAFDTIAAGARRTLRFSGALTLTYDAAKLILPRAANITTVAGDVAEFVSLGSGNWACIGYERATASVSRIDIAAAASGSNSDITGFTQPVTVPTASPTDTSAVAANMAAARSMLAAFGVGTVNGAGASDASAVTQGGMYGLASGATNNPTGTPSSLLHVPFNNGGALQLCASLTSNQRMLWRTQASGTFSAWQEVARLQSPTFTDVINVISSTGNAGMRFGRQNGSASTPYFDFISGGANIGYDFRLIAKGGSPSNTTVGTGQLSMLGAALNIGTETQNNNDRLTVSGSASVTGPFKVGQYTLSTLPSASANSGYEIDVTDAAGGTKRCRSDGTNWKILNTTTTVS